MNEIQTKSHSGSRAQFSNLFVKTQEFDIKYDKLYSQLFDWRQKGDYDNILIMIQRAFSRYSNQLRR